MKAIIFLICLMWISAAGCSTIYQANQFPSKQKYYDDFNSFASNKVLNVELKNDSTFETEEGVFIANDSLNVPVELKSTNQSISELKSELVKLDVNHNKFKKGLVFAGIKNNAEHEGKLLLDNSEMNFQIKDDATLTYIPISKIKDINYKNRWLGMASGAGYGFASGAVLGYLGSIILSAISYDSAKDPARNFFTSEANLDGTLVVGGGFAVIGALVGLIVGDKYIYKFN